MCKCESCKFFSTYPIRNGQTCRHPELRHLMERLNLEELCENHCQGKFFDKKKEYVSKMVLKVGDIVVIRNHYFGRIEPMAEVIELFKPVYNCKSGD